jgi:hypothetical protein
LPPQPPQVLTRHWEPSQAELSVAIVGTAMNAPAQILDHLFLGDSVLSRDKESLLKLNIGGVINAAAECLNHHVGTFAYKHLPATDRPTENIRLYFEDCFEFIAAMQAQGKGTFVHCAAGKSRSATIVVAYLMKTVRINLKEAWAWVKRARPVVKVNYGFFQQLMAFERELFGKKSMHQDDYETM